MGVSRILMAGLAVVLFVGVTVGCTPPPPPSGALLAVAYSNVDGIDGFDPSGGDVLIAKLLDSNADGAPSAGDTVVTNRYPLNADATQFAAFRTTTHPVADVVTTTNGSPSSAFIKVSVFSRDYPTVPAGEISWAHHPRWRPGGLTAVLRALRGGTGTPLRGPPGSSTSTRPTSGWGMMPSRLSWDRRALPAPRCLPSGFGAKTNPLSTWTSSSDRPAKRIADRADVQADRLPPPDSHLGLKT